MLSLAVTGSNMMEEWRKIAPKRTPRTDGRHGTEQRDSAVTARAAERGDPDAMRLARLVQAQDTKAYSARAAAKRQEQDDRMLQQVREAQRREPGRQVQRTSRETYSNTEGKTASKTESRAESKAFSNSEPSPAEGEASVAQKKSGRFTMDLQELRNQQLAERRAVNGTRERNQPKPSAAEPARCTDCGRVNCCCQATAVSARAESSGQVAWHMCVCMYMCSQAAAVTRYAFCRCHTLSHAVTRHAVSRCLSPSHAVTRCHTLSHAVTRCHTGCISVRPLQ